jgi:threonine dehydratase
VLRQGLALGGRILVIRSRLTDRPGELIKLLRVVAEQRANIVAIEHRRDGVALQVGNVGIELTLVTRNEEHILTLIRGIEAAGFPVERQR